MKTFNRMKHILIAGFFLVKNIITRFKINIYGKASVRIIFSKTTYRIAIT
jgi:hypothetical protein